MDAGGRSPVVAELRELLVRDLGPLIPRGPYALVDFPNHSNVGDSAIWLGELQLFETLAGRGPAYVCHRNNCDWGALERVDGPIFIHGGGNFGDIYPEHQAFREEVLRRFPGRLVVQLPQTLHYAEPAGLKRTRDAIVGHGNFVLCVRDRRSQEIAQGLGCDVLLTPDAAFALDLKRMDEPRHEVVYLHRTDVERIESDVARPPGWWEVDWLEEPRGLEKHMRRRGALAGLLTLQLDQQALRERLYRELAEHRVRRGVAILSAGKMVVTDRLHAHILSTLLGIPHIVLDNSYGKLSSFMAAWRTDRAAQAQPDLAAAVAAWEVSR